LISAHLGRKKQIENEDSGGQPHVLPNLRHTMSASPRGLAQSVARGGYRSRGGGDTGRRMRSTGGRGGRGGGRGGSEGMY
jgi:hypothetical protein